MKVGPKVDYPVRVVLEERDQDDPATGPLYRGIFRVQLNHVVELLFVPTVGAAAPPWDHRLMPEDLGAITTVEQARLATVLLAPYAVTPDEARAGTEDKLEWPAQDTPAGHLDSSIGVVFYVTGAEFDRYARDLARVHEEAPWQWPEVPVSDLRRFPVIRFIEERIVASPWLAPSDAAILGRPAPAP